MEVAVTTHPTVASAEASAKQREQSIKEERSSYFPTLDLTLNGGAAVTNNFRRNEQWEYVGFRVAWIGQTAE